MICGPLLAMSPLLNFSWAMVWPARLPWTRLRPSWLVGDELKKVRVLSPKLPVLFLFFCQCLIRPCGKSTRNKCSKFRKPLKAVETWSYYHHQILVPTLVLTNFATIQLPGHWQTEVESDFCLFCFSFSMLAGRGNPGIEKLSKHRDSSSCSLPKSVIEKKTQLFPVSTDTWP